MESLAALVAAIFIAEIAISVLNIITAILYRRGKAKLWMTSVVNTITALLRCGALQRFGLWRLPRWLRY